ncbi:MAG: glutamine synthetase III [Candidatus Kariarchaeaceae archaeon]|jgi:glutamine synthetase
MRISDIYGTMTFNQQVMEEKLPTRVYQRLLDTLERGENLDTSIAEDVAHAVKEWAMENGATHFAHWFQPLSRGTAEKHDSFLSLSSLLRPGNVIERFSKSQLVQAEPDASSFPSGGMRSTFEARGYTAWDSSSPIFIVKGTNGATMFIPSVFISYTGDALDKKTPLLRSIKVLDIHVRKLLELLETPSKGVFPTMGGEQEFFLIDRSYYLSRPDLMLTGRTLYGTESPKGQKLEDHYFGTIPTRVLEFIRELEKEAFKLGIPLTTRHNEVAPRQFEIAPIFEHVNIANDHNRLLMEISKEIAPKFDLEIIFHEKPFKGVNGSGKHNNWSMATKEGKNLLDPGHTPEEQLQFLLFICITLSAIHKRGELLRAAIAAPGNDFRLGANEAPPAIISVFLGTTITALLERIASGQYAEGEELEKLMEIELNELPDLLIGNTDRNRTSPFAFTGNKFEFRAVGSSQSLGFPNTFLNTIVVEAVDETITLFEKKLKKIKDKRMAILETITDLYSGAKSIIFNGDNYSEDWVEEATQRGLPNHQTSFDALQVLKKKTHSKLFEKYKVIKPNELEARYNVEIDHLAKIIQIEANTLRFMLRSEIIPGVLTYLGNIAAGSGSVLEKLMTQFNSQLEHSIREIEVLDEMLDTFNAEEDEVKQAKFAVMKIRPQLDVLRQVTEWFEENTPSHYWPYPTYIDILHKY